jgi:hypothetical protein
MEHYNPRCVPEWTEKEWRHHITNAKEKGHSDDLMGESSPPPKPTPKVEARPLARPVINTRKVSDIVSRPVKFLWQDWLPAGKLALLDGDPGLGKSTVLLDIAARVSQGATMPDGVYTEAGHVLVPYSAPLLMKAWIQVLA